MSLASINAAATMMNRTVATTNSFDAPDNLHIARQWTNSCHTIAMLMMAPIDADTQRPRVASIVDQPNATARVNSITAALTTATVQGNHGPLIVVNDACMAIARSTAGTMNDAAAVAMDSM